MMEKTVETPHYHARELPDRKFYFWRNVNLKISCTLLIQYSLLFLFSSLWSDEQNAPVRYARLILWRTLTSRISEGSTLKSIMDVVIKMSRYLVNVFRASTCAIYVLSLIIRRTVFNETRCTVKHVTWQKIVTEDLLFILPLERNEPLYPANSIVLFWNTDDTYSIIV